MPTHVAAMDPKKLGHNAVWFASTLAEVVAMHHFPQPVPPFVAGELQELRDVAERFAFLADYLANIMLVEDVEGVTGETYEITLEVHDSDDSEDDDESEDDDGGDPDAWSALRP